jgi:hypothetical protein
MGKTTPCTAVQLPSIIAAARLPTPRGKDLIAAAFQKHSEQMKRVFSELSPQELRGLERALKKV